MPPEAGSLSARRAMVSLFLVSLYSISFETFLTRYFSVALFSQYSYWIISIAMFGYSVSGVLLSLFERFFLQRRTLVSMLAPLLLIGFTSLAYFVLRANPFNPEQFQNENLWQTQLAYILLYYAGLFPVFFLSGTFVGLNFLVFYRRIGRVYALDLLGAAAGSIAILALMFWLHPYHLPVFMLALLFVVFLLNAHEYFGSLLRKPGLAAAAVGLAGAGLSMFYVLGTPVLSIPDFKPLHAILSVAGRVEEQSVYSPSGFYLVMDDYTERDDVPITANFKLLGIGGPPHSYGLYIDGQRVSPMLKQLPADLSYLKGSLAYFPYTIRRRPRVLLIGTDGGYKIVETARSGARQILALEQQGVPYRLIDSALRKKDPRYPKTFSVELRQESLFTALRRSAQRFDIIEVSPHFLDQDPNGRYAFTREAVELSLRSLSPNGILSIPVDISDLNVFAYKMFNTVLAALETVGVKDPAAHLLLYRTAWTCQILVSNQAFSKADIAALKKFCWNRSFDTPYYPGIVPRSIKVWNDLPPVSFESREITRSSSARDAIMEEVTAVLADPARSFHDSRYFDLRPSTLDRPDFYAVSRLGRLSTLLANMSVLPSQEVGYLFNVFVLAQALLLAALVLALPLLALRRQIRTAGRGEHLFASTVLYFSLLGLAYLFVELALIDKFSFFLESSTTAFAVILSSMLVFSGLGSWSSYRLRYAPHRGLLRSAPVIVLGLAFIAFGLDPVLAAAAGWAMPLKLPLAVAVTAPAAFAMGRFFPLGNTAIGARAANLVPWAWAVNGAFSVVSTPLANILSTSFGWRTVLVAALAMYLAALLVFPLKKTAAAPATNTEPSLAA
jgi:hypothetical protein